MLKKAKEFATEAIDTVAEKANKAYHLVKENPKCKECTTKAKETASDVVEKAGEALEEGGW
uniref:Uncharacterized protein n=1 Tax=Setaria digitata TaxID=48799 RepID=A0A915PZV4_9BILA